MRILLTFFVLATVCMQPLLAQEQQQDSTQIEQAAAEADQAIEQAEEFVEDKMNIGIKAGLNFSSLNDDEVLNADPSTGLHLGFYARYQLSQRLSAKVELLYSTQGARDDEFSIFEDYAIDLNYLSLPIMAELMIANNLRLELGPYIAVLVSSEQSFSDLQTAGEYELIETSSAETNFVDVGFGAGLTYSFQSGFGLGARYTQGFADALGNDFFGGASGSNTVFQVSGYYAF